MSSSSPSTQTSHGGPSRCGRVLGPALSSLIKNAAWRKHSQLVASAKSALEKLETITDFTSANADVTSPLWSLSASDAELVLQPLIAALESNYTKLLEPALDCVAKLFSKGLFRGEIDGGNKGIVLFRVVDAVCKCGIGEETVELGVLRVLLSALRSGSVLIRGDCLVSIVRTCYNIYLGGVNGTNQICAKAVLVQIVMVVFGRVEVDSVDVEVRTASIGELFEFTDKGLNEGISVLFCQNFVNDVMGAGNEVEDNNAVRPWLESRNGRSDDTAPGSKEGEGNETSEGGESGGGSKIREDGLMLFKNLCKLSMKFSSQEDPDDEILLRGKILSLELLKVVMDNAGPVWRTNDR